MDAPIHTRLEDHAHDESVVHEPKLHPRLQRQLEHLGLDAATPPTAELWRAFLAQLDTLRFEEGLAAEAKPVAQKAWYRQAVESSPNPIFTVDRAGRVRTWNRACQEVFGYGSEVLGQPYIRLLATPQDGGVDHLSQVLQGHTLSGLGLSYRAKDGSARAMVSRLYPLLDGDDTILGCVFANTDVTERKQAEAALQKQQAFYEHILNNVPIEIAVLDAQHRYVFCNPAAIKSDEIRAWIIGKDDFEYCDYRGFDRAVAETRRERFGSAVRGRASASWEESFVDSNGNTKHHWRNLLPVFSPDGELELVLGYGRDITERKRVEEALQAAHDELERRVEERTAELARANERLQFDAFHDALTLLPNRALFMDRLGRAIERSARRPDPGFAVLFLDFDRFKVINDSLGHSVGDALLIALGERLKRCLRLADTVARLGGDEFTILLEDASELEATRTAERIQQALLRPFALEGHSLHISASIGIVLSNLAYARAEDVLRDADLAMYHAKARGRAGQQVFTKEMRERALSLMALETDLRQAIPRRELEVYYQPIMSVAGGQPVGFEALVRWQHPVHGTISPVTFIPLAEETGLIIEIDRWVLREACAQLRVWQEQFPTLPSLTLSTNLSGQQFAREDLADKVREILAETGFDPRDLKLELTESVLMSSSDSVTETFTRLRALGVGLHIDDFGTGYSSLSYLQRFPVDTLKIDRSFINKMMVSKESAELVRTILAMAANLNLKVTAEGVETPQQLEPLRSLGRAYGQGYLFAKPLAAAAVFHGARQNYAPSACRLR